MSDEDREPTDDKRRRAVDTLDRIDDLIAHLLEVTEPPSDGDPR